MQYNTQKEPLKISEYGRNVQNMVNFIKEEQDKEKRSKMSSGLVQIMAQMNPKVKEQENYEQRLWNHLFVIAQFDLDIDAPFPKPSKEQVSKKPDQLAYPKKNPKYKQYGNSTIDFIEKAKAMKDGPEKQAFVECIANLMKKAYLNWNRDSVNDNTIYDHLKELSGGELKVGEDFTLNHTSTFAKTNNPNKNNYRKKKNNYGKGRSNKYRKR